MVGFDRIELLVADITTLDVDVIVNAANGALVGGDGAAGTAPRGPACRAIGGCPTGQSRVTPGFDLSARWIVLTVGPVWQDGHAGEADLLASCYRSALRLVAAKGARSVGFPAISCGVYGYPVERAAVVAVAAVGTGLAAHPQIERVLQVCQGVGVVEAYEQAPSALRDSP